MGRPYVCLPYRRVIVGSGDLVRVWNVVRERLGHVPSTLLGYADQLVEIEAVAALPS